MKSHLSITYERIAAALDVEPQVLFHKAELDIKNEQKIERTKNAVMTSAEKELIHSLREQIE